MDDLIRIADFAATLTNHSRPIIHQWFRQNPNIEKKPDASPVTIADKAVEDAIRTAIHQAYPHHNIIGEEAGDDISDSPYTWVVDPIDGTRAFSCGNPMFGTLIAVLYENRPIIGIVDLPIMGQTWIGVEGQSTRLNNTDIAVTSALENITQARLTTTSDHALGEDYPRFQHLAYAAMVVSYGGDCANYAHLASGFCDIVAETNLNAYDIMAVVPVITGAGGIITQWDGKPIRLDKYDGTALATASQPLHDMSLKVLGEKL